MSGEALPHLTKKIRPDVSDLARQPRRIDTSHGRFGIVVRGIPGDTNGPDHRARVISQQNTARNRNDLPTVDAIHRRHKVRLILGALHLRGPRHAQHHHPRP